MTISMALALLLAAAQPATPVQPAAAARQAEAPIVAEARAFMAGYARALGAGDRAGIAGRYDRNGAQLQGFGGDKFRSHQEIAAVYAGPSWSPPKAFEWHDLRYEQVGPEAVLVTGRFSWTPAEGAALPASYTGLLVRQEGELRIRVEHESAARPVRPAASE